MADDVLLEAVGRFAEVAGAADEPRLERAWAWGAYSDEGVRFAFFRTYEELRELAVRVAAERLARGHAPSAAQRILAQYHAAYRDLQAALLGIDEAGAARAPAEGEWPVRQALAHIVEADAGFLVVCSYALEQHRAGNHAPEKPPEAYWDATLGDEASFVAVMEGPLAGIQAYHDALHGRLLAALAGVGDGEVDLPSRYWEGYDLPLRFRLHRLDSHMRQHTVQVDKIRAAIGRAPTEAGRLMRMLYAALAEAEGAALGAPQTLASERARVAAGIVARADEIASILA